MFTHPLTTYYNRTMTTYDIAKLMDEAPELEANPYHPSNDQFEKDNEQLKRLITAQQRKLSPRNVQIVKAHFKGIKGTQIADEFGLHPNTIGKVINHPDSQRLIRLLHHFQASIDGPSIALRKAMLHRIAVDTIKEQPKTAIAAIAESNKMDVNQHNIENDGFGTVHSITINQNFFPKTDLDA